MASREEPYTSSDDEGLHAHRAKRRKGPKACDVCRRKKSDPDPSGDTLRPCVNCAVFRTDCTYTYVAKKRRTQQAYIDALQSRLNKAEKLLTALAPNLDLSKELDDGNDISPILSNLRREPPGQLQPRPPSPPKQVPRPSHSSGNPGQVVAAFTEWRDNESSGEDEDDDGLTFIPLYPSPGRATHGQQFNSLPHRFHGKSSGVVLVQKVMGMKRDHTGSGDSPVESTKRLFVKPDPWEAKFTDTVLPIPFDFPPLDLLEHLIEVFFQCVNSFLPILHRPSFEASLRDGTHTCDAAFGSVVLLLCAAASRWSDDPRVIPPQPPEPEDNLIWSSAGWEFYYQVHARYRRSLLHTTSVLDLQMIALGCIYLQGTSNPSPPWQMAGLGLRLALDVGIHRRKRPESGGLLETEQWKRAFWTLVVLDRVNSATLGRPCAIWEEDIDIDLPLELDDEYFTEEAEFKQPPDKPSRVSYFNSLVKLTQILIGALRTIYPINKAKSMCRIDGPNWEQDMVAALDSSLNGWIDNIPEHLRWDPNRTTGFFFYQSAALRCTYYNVQIVVHRPYITAKPSALSFPSLAICTNAARSLSHILDVLLRRSTMMLPMLLAPAFTSAIVLLFNIWGTNKPGARTDWQSQVGDVHICMRFIEQYNGRWSHAVKMRKIIRDLVTVGDFPLPASPPRYPGHKRTRDSEDWSDLAHPATPATASSSTSDLGGNITPHNYVPQGTGFATGSGRNDFKQEPLGFGEPQGPYFPSLDTSTSSSVQLSLPRQSSHIEAVASNPYPNTVQDAYAFAQQQPEPRSQGPHTAHDVLTALDTAYFVDSTSSLGDGVVMDVAQHSFDVWGNAPNGFQWDGWQFSNTVQNVPQAGVSEGSGGFPWSQLERGYS